MPAASPDAVGASLPRSERGRRVLWAVAAIAVGAIAAIARWGRAAMRTQREQVPHTDAMSTTVPARVQTDRRPCESAIAAVALNEAPQGLSSASNPTGSRHGETDPGVGVVAAIARRPRLAAAAGASIVVLGVSSIIMFGTLAGQPASTTESGAAGTSAQLIPAAQSEGPCRDVCPGERFDLFFGNRWLVTQVGFRPLELIPGRRVTKLRWELNDPDRTVFLQDADASAEGYGTWSLSLGQRGYRTTGVTAIVLDTVPAPGAGPSASPADQSPLAAYGNPVGDPADPQNRGFARPAEVNLNDYGSVAQQQGSSALTVRFPRPINLTSIVIGPRAGG